MEWGTPVWWGRFLLFCVPQSVKTKETNPTRPGSPTPCKQALNIITSFRSCVRCMDARSIHLLKNCINVFLRIFMAYSLSFQASC